MSNKVFAMISVLLTGIGSIIVTKYPELEWLGLLILLGAGMFLVFVEDK